ncbi:TetR/AcrR family transcriptional regulator [Nonomuraea sp. 3N208]|uniref:TetR/AcrR family transcriptional regulator n=1 Tax=Nonomuraea sp. 3N208 TaxID=3457421 RepID=UPI003FCE9535
MRNPTYFEGDLRATLLEVAEEEVAGQGFAQVSLRSIAKRAGVSHAAPAYHFQDKRGLFTALAVEGFTELGTRMRGALSRLDAAPAADRIQELGMVYIGFARERPGLFEVMWRPELHHRDDPALRAGAQATKDTMTQLIVQAQQEGWSTRPDTLHLVVLGWAAVHGLAVLWRDGPLADQNEGADPYELGRAVLGTLAAALQARPS